MNTRLLKKNRKTRRTRKNAKRRGGDNQPKNSKLDKKSYASMKNYASRSLKSMYYGKDGLKIHEAKKKLGDKYLIELFKTDPKIVLKEFKYIYHKFNNRPDLEGISIGNDNGNEPYNDGIYAYEKKLGELYKEYDEKFPGIYTLIDDISQTTETIRNTWDTVKLKSERSNLAKLEDEFYKKYAEFKRVHLNKNVTSSVVENESSNNKA